MGINFFGFVFWFCIVVFALVMIWHLCTRFLINPYKIHFFYGKKGAGKSTMMTAIALDWISKGKKVYSNYPIVGCYLIDARKDVGFYKFPQESVILVDEAGSIWNNRDYKSFPKEMRDFSRYVRKNRLRFYMWSQTFDVDKVLRDQSDFIYLVENFLRCFVLVRRIDKRIAPASSFSDNSESNSRGGGVSPIVESYDFASLLTPNAFQLYFIPKYIPYFESYFPAELEESEIGLPYLPISDEQLELMRMSDFKRFKRFVARKSKELLNMLKEKSVSVMAKISLKIDDLKDKVIELYYDILDRFDR